MSDVRHIVSTKDALWSESRLGPRLSGEVNLRSAGTHDRDWEGFGGCFNELGWEAIQGLSAEERGRLFDGLFGADGLSLDIGRLPMGASDYAAGWHSYDETEGDFALKDFSIARDRERLFPYVKEALARRPDLRFFSSPWSPPTWMKSPPVYNHGTFRMEPSYLSAYADYFVKYVESCEAAGIRIEAVHPQNEPAADQKFPSCVWTGEKLAQFIGGYLGPAMAAKCPRVGVWLGTMNTHDYAGMFLPVLNSPACRELLKGVGLQWAGKHIAHKLEEACPELPRWQTENECGDGKNTWAYAHYVFELFTHYIRTGASAYVYWNMALLPGGTSTWGWHQNSLAVINTTTRTFAWQPEFWVMKHFSHFVRPGDRPLRLRGLLASWSAAFSRPNGSVVLVVHNPTKDEIPLRCDIAEKSLGARLLPGTFNTFVF